MVYTWQYFISYENLSNSGNVSVTILNYNSNHDFKFEIYTCPLFGVGRNGESQNNLLFSSHKSKTLPKFFVGCDG